MEKLAEKILVLAVLVLAVCLGLDAVLAHRTHLLGPAALQPLLWSALVVAAAVFARMRLARLAAEEQRAEELARRERPESALFERAEGEFEPFTLARSRAQFERYVVPAVAPLLAVLQLVLAWRIRRALGQVPAEAAEPLLAGSFLAGQAFALFLLSRYMLGLARSPAARLLRGPGVCMGLACFASLAAAAAAFVAATAYPRADRIAAWVLAAALVVLAVENILAGVAWIYRPRRAPGELNTAYESRLGALLTDPATWVRSVAQALDYQFGFGISQTWFYRFLQNALVPLLVFQILVLYLLSCLAFLGPEEEGILERFGRPLDPAGPRGHLESGFHLKWPWPFETVRRFPARRLQHTVVGVSEEEAHHHPDVVLWTVPHFHNEEMFLVASGEAGESFGDGDAAVPVNFLALNIPVAYRITNVYQYAYTYAEPERLIAEIARRGATREAVGRGLFDMIGAGQLETAARLKQGIQAEADRLGLGIHIEFVGVQGVHPPVPVAEAFESVIGALEQRETAILEARAYTKKILPLADAEAATNIAAAAAYRARRIELAAAEGYRFEQRLKAYQQSPEVFRTDLYLRTLSEALQGARKYIVSAVPASEVIQLNFEEKLRPDLFDLGPAPRKGEGSGP